MWKRGFSVGYKDSWLLVGKLATQLRYILNRRHRTIRDRTPSESVLIAFILYGCTELDHWGLVSSSSMVRTDILNYKIGLVLALINASATASLKLIYRTVSDNSK